MIIKKGTKYYEVIRELTEDDFNEKKDKIQSQYDEFDLKCSDRIKALEEKYTKDKQTLKLELDNLKLL